MIARSRMLRCFPRSAVLATSLGAALGLLPDAHATDTSVRASNVFNELVPVYLRSGAEVTSGRTSSPIPAPRTVDNCNDDGSQGTLRAEIEAAADGATIDLSQLTCSTITLGSKIQILQDSLNLSGPGAENLTISGDNHSSVFQHLGIGTLSISGLTIADGYHFNTGPAKGGCIYSVANVTLTGSVVSNCILASSTSYAEGAGVYTAGDLTLTSSTITGNHATALVGGLHALGGGAFVSIGTFHSKYSTISDNWVHDYSPYPGGSGGGILTLFGGAQIENSTFSGNTADDCAAIYAGNTPLSVTNSTISGNSATESRGAICGQQAAMTLTNSTVAFNKSPARGAGISIAFADLTLQSSIVADNIGISDIGGSSGFMVLGSNNLVRFSDLQLPGDTIPDCPKLDALADNGGVVRTHALRLGSPAIDQGNNNAGLTHDERGAARVTGPFADIGAFERQASDVDQRIFFDGFDGGSGGLCDQ